MPSTRLPLRLVALFALLLTAPAAAQTLPSAPAPGLDARRALEAVAPYAVLHARPDGVLRAAAGLRLALPGDDAAERAIGFWARFGSAFGVRPSRLSAPAVRESHGFTLVRHQRQLDGAALYGGAAVLLFAPDGRLELVRVAGALRGVSGAAQIDAAGAEAIAEEAFAGHRALETSAVAIPRGELVAPAFRVLLRGESVADQRWVTVDATSGEIWAAVSLQREALGRVYDADPVTSEAPTDLDLPFLTSLSRLTGRYVRVASCAPADGECNGVQRAEADENGDFLFEPVDPSFDDPFAEVMAYFHLNRVMTYFRDAHDYAWFCDEDSILRAFVNFTVAPNQPFGNAFYSPTTGQECGFLAFGQGTRDFVYDEDVIYHEYGHAMVDQTSGLEQFLVDRLGASFDPGALNEGTADYFAATLAGDPQMAEYFDGIGTGEGEGALRVLENDLVCPNDLSGQVHTDGRIWGGASWDLREALGPELADQLIFLGQAALEPTASFADAAESVLMVADALVAAGDMTVEQRATAEGLLEARGLIGCERIVPLADGDDHRAYTGLNNVNPFVASSIAPVHYRVDVPAGASELRFRISGRNSPVRFYLRRGQAVEVDDGRPVADAVVRPGADGALTLDSRSELPLPNCETLFVAIAFEDLTTVQASFFTLEADMQNADPTAVCPGGDAGPIAAGDGGLGADAGPDGGASGGGCGCRTVGAASAPPMTGWLGLGLLGAALVWRRRR